VPAWPSCAKRTCIPSGCSSARRHAVGATRTATLEPPSRKTVHDWHEATLQDAGLRDMPLHALRHTAAASWLVSGHPLIFVQRQLGHRSITTTEEHYGHLESSFSATRRPGRAVDRGRCAESRPLSVRRRGPPLLPAPPSAVRDSPGVPASPRSLEPCGEVRLDEAQRTVRTTEPQARDAAPPSRPRRATTATRPSRTVTSEGFRRTGAADEAGSSGSVVPRSGGTDAASGSCGGLRSEDMRPRSTGEA
jgi:hypothetical protein